MAEHEPNQGLRELLNEARWTQAESAAAINRAAAEAGVPPTCDKSNVNKWLGGTRPQAKWHPLIVEAFSRRLGRPVTRVEAGLPPSVAETGTLAALTLPGDTVEGLVSIGREDMDPSRRRILTTMLYAAALPVPAYIDLAGRAEAHASGRTRRVGAGEVATVRTMTDRIADILDELGAGHARPMAAAFLVNTVAPYLRADASEAVKKDLLSAASDLVYLTGWMAMYEKAHGLGQRYYVQALHLAADAGDHVTYCRTLRGMALQAADLRHAKRALDLADSAAEAAPKAGPRLQAFLAGQQAQGAALVGDRRMAFSRLAQTQAALSKADNRRDAIGGYDQAAYFFHVSSVLYALGDVPGSITAMQDSQRVRPPIEKQGRAHASGLIAQRQLEIGHVEASCETWHGFLDDYEHLSSSRADEHFDALRRRLRPHVKNRHAREVYERATELARRKAA
jgi:hypothetical protein